ncbi:HigA family addiction module antitoxin [Hydrogenimonas cancrithermarum]|uniref:Transcriptional regulator n=1 Tax=Hydrogenimonas cancrithermarum TaxID=2993563 RepID=A0ABN6WRW2_9BACT|nr:HigA family addiction module antitoxin [Hydrogenimonas cancrithermarum]BDY11905.1 transcriptional regulator [Hydrogenimonas cancrithermarum]
MNELQREPTHPGEILLEEFLKPLGLTQSALAKDLHTSFRAVNELVNGKRGITTEMALKLARYFGTTPQLWLNLQNSYDLYRVGRKKADEIEAVKRCEVA